MAYLARQLGEDNNRTPSQALQQSQQGGGSQNGLQKNASEVGAPVTGPAGAATQTSKPVGDFTKANFSNASDILNRNQGTNVSAITNRLLGNTEQNAAATNKSIADQVNKYKTDTTNQINSTYKAPTEMIDSAITGDQATNSKLTSFLNGAPEQVKDVNLGQINPIAPSEVFKEKEYQPLLQSRSNGGYTSGMGALDSAFFNRNNAAQQVRDKVARLQEGVNQNVTAAKGVKGQLQDYANSYSATQKQALRDALGQDATKIQSQVSARLPAAQKAALESSNEAAWGYQGQMEKQIREAMNKISDMQYAKAHQAVNTNPLDGIIDLSGNLGVAATNDIGDYGKPQLEQLRQMNIPSLLAPYITQNTPELNDQDVATQNDADVYNRIQGLLGTNKTMAVGPQKTGGAAFDKNAFQQKLNDILAGVEQQQQPQAGFDPTGGLRF